MSEDLATAPGRAAPLARRLALLYLGISAALLLALAVVLGVHGREGFRLFQVAGLASSLELNFAVFCLSWLLVGAGVWLVGRPALARRHAIALGALALISFQTLGAIREPHVVGAGDFDAYYVAATEIRAGVALGQDPNTYYLYPPLLATVLAPLVPLGEDGALRVFQFANALGVILLGVLLYLSLQRFRLSRELAGLAVAILLLANVPLARSLIYQQVNVHLVNLMLVCFLLARRAPVASALALALAVHLKVYPGLLALPFLLDRRWRWCAWFAVWNLAIVAATSLANSPSYYLQFVQQLGVLEENARRNVAVESFVHNSLRFFQLNGGDVDRALTLLLKLSLVAGAVAGYVRHLRSTAFCDPRAEPLLANAFTLLPLVMISVSPSVWPHHFLLLSLTLPVLASALRGGGEWALFAAAYAFLQLVPVNDIYPVSYLRLLAMVLLIVLVHRMAAPGRETAPPWLGPFRERLAALRS